MIASGPGRPFRLFGAAVCVAAMLFAAPALAHRVRCPVCGQEFETGETPVCPNDGTDLVREGRPVEAREDEERGEPGEEEGEQAGEGAPAGSAPKFQRHDVGGDRQRSDDEGSAYSDREQRLGEERRGQASAAAAAQRKQRERERARFVEEDGRLRREFEERRQELAEQRRREAFAAWQSGRERLRPERGSLWERAAPLTSVGVRLSWMGEGRHPGPIAGAELDVNPLKTRVRAGLSAFLGVRQLEDRGELLFLGNASVGLQIPWRWSPYLVARGGLGVLASERFGEDLNLLVLSAGLEAGLDCHITESIVVTPAVGWARYLIEDADWDTATLRLGVGF